MDTRDPRHRLNVAPLTAEAFAPFGDVIEAAASRRHHPVNAGLALRFHDLATLDTGRDGGRPMVSIFRAQALAQPLRLRLVERHLLGSQAFVPMAGQRFLVVVAPAGPAPRREDLRAFVTSPGQGVNYAAGTWHHPLLSLDGGDYLVIDRGGPGGADDCEESAPGVAGLWLEA